MVPNRATHHIFHFKTCALMFQGCNQLPFTSILKICNSQKNNCDEILGYSKITLLWFQLYCKRTGSQVFSCELCDFLQVRFFAEHLWEIASVNSVPFRFCNSLILLSPQPLLDLSSYSMQIELRFKLTKIKALTGKYFPIFMCC